MTITVNVVVALVAYGNPGSLGEPLGLWAGEANVTGDASGGFVQVTFTPQVGAQLPDERLSSVFFVDGVMIQSSLDAGSYAAKIIMHMARSNVALGDRFFHQVASPSVPAGGDFTADNPLMADHMTRTPIFWDTQELVSGNSAIVRLLAQNNVNTALYTARAYGRYYDRQILSNRTFGRLVSPPAQSQFGGR